MNIHPTDNELIDLYLGYRCTYDDAERRRIGPKDEDDPDFMAHLINWLSTERFASHEFIEDSSWVAELGDVLPTLRRAWNISTHTHPAGDVELWRLYQLFVTDYVELYGQHPEDDQFDVFTEWLRTYISELNETAPDMDPPFRYSSPAFMSALRKCWVDAAGYGGTVDYHPTTGLAEPAENA